MASDPLLELIKSLTEGEKRDFRKKGVGSSYMELFDAMEGMRVYNKDKVKEQLRNPVFAKNLSAGKNYLYRHILESLRILHGRAKPNPSPEVAVSEYWANVHVLWEKNLFAQIFKLISQAKKHCKAYHLLHDSLKFILLERRLISRFQQKDLLKKLGRLHAECLEIQRHLDMELKLFQVYEQIWVNYRNADEQKLKIALTDGMAFLNVHKNYFSESPSFNNLAYYHFCLAINFETARDFKKACFHFAAILGLYDKDPKLKEANMDRYIGILRNYFTNLAKGPALYSHREFDKFMARLQALQGKDLKTKLLIEQQNLYYPLLYYLSSGEFGRALKYKIPILEWLDRHKNKIQHDSVLTFQYLLAIAHLMEGLKNPDQKNEMLDESLKLLDAIEQNPRDDIMTYLKSIAKSFQIVVYFEQGAETLAASRARSILGKLRKQKRTNSIEYAVVNSIKKVIPIGNKGRKWEIFDQLRTKLRTLKDTELILIWVEMKLEEYSIGKE